MGEGGGEVKGNFEIESMEGKGRTISVVVGRAKGKGG